MPPKSDLTSSGEKKKRRKRSQKEPLARPRLEEVARSAGVSTATVSRVLNRPSEVTPMLRRNVLSAVELLGYVPHGPARALATRRSHTVGTVIPTMDNAIFARTVQALESALHDAGYTLLLASSDYDHARERTQVQILIERGIDGLMLIGELHDPGVYELLEKERIPHINTWIYREESSHPCAGFDNREGAFRITSYLLDIGHRSIAMIAGITRGNDRAAARIEGVRAALAERGVDFYGGRPFECPYHVAEGRRAAGQFLANDTLPTAIVCGNDVLALGVLFECQARGIDVPGQVSVTGFDDLDIAANVEPPLTTMRIPSAEMGRRAAQYLLACMDDVPTLEKTMLEASLIIRGTTAPPRTS